MRTKRRQKSSKWNYLYGLLVNEVDQLRDRVLILEQRDGDQERAADRELAHLAGHWPATLARGL